MDFKQTWKYYEINHFTRFLTKFFNHIVNESKWMVSIKKFIFTLNLHFDVYMHDLLFHKRFSENIDSYTPKSS